MRLRIILLWCKSLSDKSKSAVELIINTQRSPKTSTVQFTKIFLKIYFVSNSAFTQTETVHFDNKKGLLHLQS